MECIMRANKNYSKAFIDCWSKLTKIPLVVLCEIIDLYVFISKTEKLNTTVDFAARGFHIR